MMPDLVFAIDGKEARLSDPVSLRDISGRQPGSYTSWIVQHPQLLGPRVRIVAADLRRESDAAEVRIDVLGLGDDGRLVVGAVLVDEEPDQVLPRALIQAAYASRLQPDTLAEMHARQLRRQGQHVTEDVALHHLVSHIGQALDPELLAKPRMVLFTEQLSSALGTTTVWLDEMGLDIVLQRLHAHQMGDQQLLLVSRVFPPEPVTEFETARPRHLRPVTRLNLAPEEPRQIDIDVDARREAGTEFDRPARPAPAEVESADPEVVYTNGFGHQHRGS